ncbi:MAG: hypothetical protein AB7S69_13120 [Salinivirgaceae bacterium]
MKLIYLYLFITSLLFSSCLENNKSCHYDILFNNESNYDIIWARLAYYDTLCSLNGNIVKSKETYIDHSPRHCWEDILLPEPYEIFIIDTSLFNNEGVFYCCDSIAIKNKVLKHYILSLEDLKQSDFTITYP